MKDLLKGCLLFISTLTLTYFFCDDLIQFIGLCLALLKFTIAAFILVGLIFFLHRNNLL